MSEFSLDEAMENNASALGRIIRRVATLRHEDAGRRPLNGGWSAGEHLEHLAISDVNILAVVKKLLERLEQHPPAAGSGSVPAVSIDEVLLRAGREKYRAAAGAVPKGGQSPSDSLARLSDIHRQLESLKARIEAVPLHGASFPHRVFGPLSLGQWVAFVGIHEERHLGHIERVLESLR
jgi:hypothetical protein